MIRVEVRLSGGRSYPVLVGPEAVGELASVVPSGARRVAVVTQASIPVEVDPGVDHRVFTIGEGESAKTLSTVEDLCRAFASWGLTRADAVVGVGGGVVTDVTGFAAASYHRGLPVVHVATTLLAQIDAAIVVTITPTYSGCPAMQVMTEDIAATLRQAGYDNFRISTRLAPAWTTDWLSELGRQQLRLYGIAPPRKEKPIHCPRCDATDIRLISQFGSTPCKALYQCRNCAEPFDYFKPI